MNHFRTKNKKRLKLAHVKEEVEDASCSVWYQNGTTTQWPIRICHVLKALDLDAHCFFDFCSLVSVDFAIYFTNILKNLIFMSRNKNPLNKKKNES